MDLDMFYHIQKFQILIHTGMVVGLLF